MSQKMQDYINNMSDEEILEHADYILSILDEEDCLTLFKEYLNISKNVDLGTDLQDEDREKVKNLVIQRWNNIDKEPTTDNSFSIPDIIQNLKMGIGKLQEDINEDQAQEELDDIEELTLIAEELADKEAELADKEKELAKKEEALKQQEEVLAKKEEALKQQEVLTKKKHAIKQQKSAVADKEEAIDEKPINFKTFLKIEAPKEPKPKQNVEVSDKIKILLRIKQEIQRLEQGNSIVYDGEITKQKIAALVDLAKLIKYPSKECTRVDKIIESWLGNTEHFRENYNEKKSISTKIILEQKRNRFDFFTHKNDTLDFVQKLREDFADIDLKGATLKEIKPKQDIVVSDKEKILFRIKQEMQRLEQGSSIIYDSDVTKLKVQALEFLYLSIQSPENNSIRVDKIIESWLKNTEHFQIQTKDTEKKHVSMKTILEQQRNRFDFFTHKNDTLDFVQKLREDFTDVVFSRDPQQEVNNSNSSLKANGI